MICSWIINVIDLKLHTSIAYVETAAVMWESLWKRYVMANTPKIHQLKADIATFNRRKTTNDSGWEQINRLKIRRPLLSRSLGP